MNNKQKQIAYALLRITMGVNFLGHGIARIGKIPLFRDWMLSQFKNSILPGWSVYAWGSILPILELSVGLLLILGLFTYRTAIVGASMIAALILGSTLIENWEWAGGQMLYALFFYFILMHMDDNNLSLDQLIKKGK